MGFWLRASFRSAARGCGGAQAIVLALPRSCPSAIAGSCVLMYSNMGNSNYFREVVKGASTKSCM